MPEEGSACTCVTPWEATWFTGSPSSQFSNFVTLVLKPADNVLRAAKPSPNTPTSSHWEFIELSSVRALSSTACRRFSNVSTGKEGREGSERGDSEGRGREELREELRTKTLTDHNKANKSNKPVEHVEV